MGCYDQALTLEPRDAGAWNNNKGKALDGLGRREEAIGCYDQALAIDPRARGRLGTSKGLALAELRSA